MILVLDEMHLVPDSEESCPFYVSLKLVWLNSGPVSQAEASMLKLLHLWIQHQNSQLLQWSLISSQGFGIAHLKPDSPLSYTMWSHLYPHTKWEKKACNTLSIYFGFNFKFSLHKLWMITPTAEESTMV